MYKLSPEQKKVVIAQQKARRAAARIVSAELKEKRRLELLQAEKEKRKADRIAGKPDLRTKEHRLKPNRVPALKSTPSEPEKRTPQSPKISVLKKDRKPRLQASVCKIPTQDPTTTKTYIPELRMSVYLRPDQTVQQVITKYNQRPGAKITKW